MKPVFVSALVFIAMLLGLSACENPAAEQKAKTLAEAVADKLGRTPANHLITYKQCGAFVCTIDVYFFTSEAVTDFQSRFGDLPSLGVTVRNSGSQETTVTTEVNADLSRSQIKERFTAVSNQEPRVERVDWGLGDSNNRYVVEISYFGTRQPGIGYTFDGKTFTSHLVRVRAFLHPSQR